MTADNSKGITAISYNLLNLPQTITGKSTTYTYDAQGQKLSRLIGTAKTDYIDGIQYDGTAASSTITFIQTEEGRALPKDATAYNYEYSLTDHLGNSRVNFDTGTGTARQVQVDDYYPFGMEISTSVASPKNEYLYNKKELQENVGLYDYGARFYDPVIARWTSVDPLVEVGQESTTPYGYVFGNPIRLTDPDGRYPDGDDDPVMNGDFAARLVKTVIHDAVYGLFNTLNRQVGSPYRLGYKTVNGQQTFDTEIYKEALPKTVREVGSQALSTAGDAAMVIPEVGQAKTLFAKTVTEATAGKEAKNILIRFGPEAETKTALAKDAAKAEAGGFPHGVSTRLSKSGKIGNLDARTASKEEVEKVFKVEQTGNDPRHHTVFLPKPVTDEATEWFNNLFKPKK